MTSNVTHKIDYFDTYAGKSIMQRVLTDSPNYDGVIGFIRNDTCNASNAIIYNIDLEPDIKQCYMVVKFDNDTCGNNAPWITQFALSYDGDTIDTNNIVNTNDVHDVDKCDNNHIVCLKFA